MRRDEDIRDSRVVRRARSVSQGTPFGSATAGGGMTSLAVEDAKVTEDNLVRRLWTPGDPWSDKFYFGSTGDSDAG